MVARPLLYILNGIKHIAKLLKCSEWVLACCFAVIMVFWMIKGIVRWLLTKILSHFLCSINKALEKEIAPLLKKLYELALNLFKQY